MAKSKSRYVTPTSNRRPNTRSSVGVADAASIASSVASILGSSRSFNSYTGTGGTNTERAQNEDTRLNLNSTFNATSLYTKTKRKRKHLSKKTKSKRKSAKKFKKKVKKVLTARGKLNHFNVNGNANKTLTTVPFVSFGDQFTAQDIYPQGLSAWMMLGTAQLANTSQDIVYPVIQMADMGHVEEGVAVTDAGVGENKTKIWFSGTLEFDIACYNVEYTDTNPLYIDVYECLCKKSANISEAAWNNPFAAWNNGLATEQYNRGDVAAVPTVPYLKGQIPSACPEFNKWWTVDTVTRIRVASAAPYHIKMFTSGTYQQRLNETRYTIAGVTKACMLVIQPTFTAVNPANYNIQICGINKSFKYKRMDEPNVTPNPMVTWNVQRNTNF